MAELALPIDRDTFELAAGGLRENGWWVGENALDRSLVDELRGDLNELMETDRLHRAGIGRERDFHLDRGIRSDRVFWLTRQRPVQTRFLKRMEQLRLSLNRELFLGLFEFEAHYAHYPPGGLYRKHLDSFRGAANRVVSAVTYLTENWQPCDGGELVVYGEDGESVSATVEPRAGTFVLFLSEEVPHEVLTSRTDRTSIAGWFRLNTSIGGQIDPAR
ncbi:2OG-Fe(II) oxygenase [Wenzhouxiangella sp. EGI_FJ10305]|uniref:2OG-Fe(II) oxygenase n=1 Tax=Wenzhouxiangella sp. EGI_FJ10305 TaxID=3243768 RepID=UPI0035DB910D